VIRFAPETRIPRNYARFVGLIEDLFAKGAVPPERPLIRLERGVSVRAHRAPLIRLERGVSVRALRASVEGPAWAFAEGGERIDLPREVGRLEVDLLAVIGGFPHGDFRSPVRDVCDRVVSIHPAPLTAWTVAGELLAAYRHRASSRAP